MTLSTPVVVNTFIRHSLNTELLDLTDSTQWQNPIVLQNGDVEEVTQICRLLDIATHCFIDENGRDIYRGIHRWGLTSANLNYQYELYLQQIAEREEVCWLNLIFMLCHGGALVQFCHHHQLSFNGAQHVGIGIVGALINFIDLNYNSFLELEGGWIEFLNQLIVRYEWL